MAAHVPKAPGYLQMLTSGSRYYSGQEEVVYRNIEACIELSRSLKAVYGPSGLNKLVINHLEKILVTANTATILQEYQIEHPAANMLLQAVKMQEEEVGDGRNFVLILAGALLENAGGLLRMGLSVPEVVKGYRKGCKKALDVLENLTCSSLKNIGDLEEVASLLRTPIGSKQHGYRGFLSGLVAQSCVSVMGRSTRSFQPDQVRVCKILGAGILDSLFLEGMAFKRETEGLVNAVQDARVVIYQCAFDLAQTETKGTVLLKNAREMLNYSQGEEILMETQVRELAGSGVNVVVVGGKIGDLAMHYADKYNLMVVRLQSRHDLQRLGKAVGTAPLMKLIIPLPNETGHCERVYAQEMGDTQVVVFEQRQGLSAMATIILRGSTENLQDNVEQAVVDGVNAYRVLSQDGRLLPGAGATEMELSVKIADHASTCPGLDQYTIKGYAKAFESLVEALVQNSGEKEGHVLARLCAIHQEGGRNVGFDLEGGEEEGGGGVLDAAEAGIFDSYLVKFWGIKLATNAAVTILSVDQIIMAKKSGGPKPRGDNANWDEPPDHID